MRTFFACTSCVPLLCLLLLMKDKVDSVDLLAPEKVTATHSGEAGVFTVTMTSLKESDEDKYWCVISRSGRNVYKGVRLVITQKATTPTTTKNSYLAQKERSLWHHQPPPLTMMLGRPTNVPSLYQLAHTMHALALQPIPSPSFQARREGNICARWCQRPAKTSNIPSINTELT
ncbi:hypothetical protein CRENBAI_000494 [Crenichthys baileyi]|uniref:Immunoglobulin V-set domain-containing protein n=1 Tax=Crenichthys baileyi TaxID=28760 RepID=A0AAV9RWG8_9TELE